MAIPKISSQNLNDILTQAQDRITTIGSDVNAIRADMIEKLKVIKNEQEYAFAQLTAIKEVLNGSAGTEVSNKIIFANASWLAGKYDTYGATIHPKFIQNPVQVFNIKTPNSYLFIDNSVVTIDNLVSTRFKDMLKHNSIPGQQLAFDEFTTNKIIVSITINPGDLLGNTTFNTIEIAPFLAGSFTIDSAQVYTMQSFKTGETFADYTMYGIQNVGPCRILLDKKYDLYKIVLTITLHYRNLAGKYPFGIRHLYFYNANYDQTSYVIGQIKKTNYIDWYSNNIMVQDVFSKFATSITEQNMSCYMGYVNNILEYLIPASAYDAENILSRNTKNLYVKIPLTNRSLIGMEFNKIQER